MGWSREKSCRFRFETLERRRLLAANAVIDETFEDGVADFSGIYSNNAFAGVVAEPDGNRIFEALFTENETQSLLGDSLGVADSVEVSFDFRIPGGVPIEGTNRGHAGVKISRILAPPGAPPFHAMQNEVQAFRNADGSVRHELQFYAEQSGIVANLVVDPTQWINVRYRITFNTPGQADGTLTVWLDGEKVVDHDSVVWAEEIQNRPDGFWVGGNISFGDEQPSRPFVRQYDNIRVLTESNSESEPVATDGIQVVQRDGQGVVVTGTELDDAIRLVASADGNVSVSMNGVDKVFSDMDWLEIDSGDGNDRIEIQSEIPTLIQAGNGDDSIHARGQFITMDAGAGDDFVWSTASSSVIAAGGGDDFVIAYGGGQIVIGGEGVDTLISFATTAPNIVIGGSVDLPLESLAAFAVETGELVHSPGLLEMLLPVRDDLERDRLFLFGDHWTKESGDRVYRW